MGLGDRPGPIDACPGQDAREPGIGPGHGKGGSGREQIRLSCTLGSGTHPVPQPERGAVDMSPAQVPATAAPQRRAGARKDQMRALRVLASRGRLVIRVPDIAAGLQWWRQHLDAEVTRLCRVNDLEIAVLRVRGQTACRTFVFLGGPGAMEYHAAGTSALAEWDSDDDVDRDPWGNPVPRPCDIRSGRTHARRGVLLTN